MSTSKAIVQSLLHLNVGDQSLHRVSLAIVVGMLCGQKVNNKDDEHRERGH